jgi:hypothetical protein
MAEEKKGKMKKGDMPVHNIKDWMSTLTEEEQRQVRVNGGKKSGETRRAHKPMRDVLKMLMAMDTTDPDMHEILTKLGLEPTNDNAVALAQILQATQKREAESARFIRDTLGEKPTEQYNLAVNKPIQAMDLGQMSDEELAALADRQE